MVGPSKGDAHRGQGQSMHAIKGMTGDLVVGLLETEVPRRVEPSLGVGFSKHPISSARYTVFMNLPNSLVGAASHTGY
jgi:hypothetical protein